MTAPPLTANLHPPTSPPAGSGPERSGDASTAPRSWPVLLLAAPAFVAIWSGWVGLGGLTGFGTIQPLPGTPLAGWTLNTAITLPIGVEAYAAYALRVWLTTDTPPGDTRAARAVRFARVSAVASLILGAAGQIAYHLMTAANMIRAPWWIVTVVACLPVAVLGMGAALAHLVRDITHHPRPDTDPTASTAASRPDTSPDTRADTGPDTTTHSTPDAEPDTRPDIGADVKSLSDNDSGPVRRPGRQRGRKPGGRGPVSTGEAVARLRRRHPDLSTTAIATRLGVTDRTVRRYLADQPTQPPTAPSRDQAGASVPFPMEVAR